MQRKRLLIPNTITSLSLVFATCSVFASLQGRFEWAGWLIVWCVLLDKADGAAARVLDACSDFGLQMDSLVDLVAFGIAPVTLTYALLVGPQGVGMETMSVVPSCLIYVICVTARLALFNVTESAPKDPYFRGIPSTLGGALIATGFLSWQEFGEAREVLSYGPTILLGLGILMVCPLRLAKLAARKNRLVNATQAVAVVLTYMCGILRMLPQALFALGATYMLLGLISGNLGAGRKHLKIGAKADATKSSQTSAEETEP